MNNYSIVKIGSEYVVLADEQRILKLASHRKAVKLVVDAAELLSEQSVPASRQQRRPSIARDLRVIPDPRKVP